MSDLDVFKNAKSVYADSGRPLQPVRVSTLKVCRQSLIDIALVVCQAGSM